MQKSDRMMWMNIWTDNVSGRQEMNGSKDLKTIIYFKGVYDTLDLFTDHLIGAFESMGYGTFVYHTANEKRKNRKNIIYGIIFISHILTFSWIIRFIMRNRFAICRKRQ